MELLKLIVKTIINCQKRKLIDYGYESDWIKNFWSNKIIINLRHNIMRIEWYDCVYLKKKLQAICSYHLENKGASLLHFYYERCTSGVRFMRVTHCGLAYISVYAIISCKIYRCRRIVKKKKRRKRSSERIMGQKRTCGYIKQASLS